MSENKLYPELKRGTVVHAIRHLDQDGADVHTGDIGVVFEEAGFHEEGTGPMVRWIMMDSEVDGSLHSGGACNIYEGDVRVH